MIFLLHPHEMNKIREILKTIPGPAVNLNSLTQESEERLDPHSHPEYFGDNKNPDPSATVVVFTLRVEDPTTDRFVYARESIETPLLVDGTTGFLGMMVSGLGHQLKTNIERIREG